MMAADYFLPAFNSLNKKQGARFKGYNYLYCVIRMHFERDCVRNCVVLQSAAAYFHQNEAS